MTKEYSIYENLFLYIYISKKNYVDILNFCYKKVYAILSVKKTFHVKIFVDTNFYFISSTGYILGNTANLWLVKKMAPSSVNTETTNCQTISTEELIKNKFKTKFSLENNKIFNDYIKPENLKLKINGKWLNLSKEFVSKHPGGAVINQYKWFF